MTEASGEKRSTEGTPDLETLRGPNTTLQLAHLIEQTLKYSSHGSAYSGYDQTVLQHAILRLQDFAEPIDRAIRIEASVTPYRNRDHLGVAARKLVDQGIIPSQLELMDLFMFYGKSRLARQDQWHLIKALFDIDTTLLTKGSVGGVSLANISSLVRVHDYMVRLIATSVGRLGGELVESTSDEQAFLIQREYKAPTTIKGVPAILTVSDTGFMNAHGYPNIIGVTLDFGPSFLASVRPLGREDFMKYFSDKNKEDEQRQESESRDYKREDKREHRREEASYARASESAADSRDPKGYYKTLGVNPDTDPGDVDDVILAAYRRLSRKYHSDTGGETANHQRMVGINKAYDFLSKPENRRNYGRR